MQMRGSESAGMSALGGIPIRGRVRRALVGPSTIAGESRRFLHPTVLLLTERWGPLRGEHGGEVDGGDVDAFETTFHGAVLDAYAVEGPHYVLPEDVYWFTRGGGNTSR